MAGILLYTAAPDSEGTLGGLVALGDPKALGRHLDQALEAMRLCASDPLCAEHHPMKDGLTLHGAACHACLFLPETSCERGNKYLDRSVLVSTVESETWPSSPLRGIDSGGHDHRRDGRGGHAAQAGGIGPGRGRQAGGPLRRAGAGVRRSWIDGSCQCPKSGTSYRTKGPGLCPGGTGLARAGKSPRCCPRGATSGPNSRSGAGRSRDATALANHETELRTILGT